MPEEVLALRGELGDRWGLRKVLGFSWVPDLLATQEQAVQIVQAALGAAAFATGWEAGQALALEDAIALALADDGSG